MNAKMEQAKFCRISLPYDFEMPQLKSVVANDPRLDGGYLSESEVSNVCGFPVAQVCFDEFPHYEELREKGSLSWYALAERKKAIKEWFFEKSKGFLSEDENEALALKTAGLCLQTASGKTKMMLQEALRDPLVCINEVSSSNEKVSRLFSEDDQETQTTALLWDQLFPDVSMNWRQDVIVARANDAKIFLPSRSCTSEDLLVNVLRVPRQFLMPEAGTIGSLLAVQLHEIGHAGGQLILSAEMTSLQEECFSFLSELHADKSATKACGQDWTSYRYLVCHTNSDPIHWLGPVHEAVRDGKQIPIYTDIRRAGMEILSRYYYALSDHTGPVRENDLNFQSANQFSQWNNQNYLHADTNQPESFYVLDCLQQGGVFDNSEKPLASHMARQMVKAAELVYGRNCIEAEGKHFLASKSVEKQRQIHALKQNWAGASTVSFG